MSKYRQALLWLLLIAFGWITFKADATVHAQQAATQNDSDVRFQWAFGILKKEADSRRFEIVNRDTVLTSGDQLKFYIQLKAPCFVYLIYHSSQGELSVLFPHRFRSLSTDSKVSEPHYIPKEDQWFELDNHVGQETFYLLASAGRLTELEALVNDYESADSSRKSLLVQQIVTRIRQLRKQHLKFKTYAERPVSVIGNLRGTEKLESSAAADLAQVAVEISADTFFSRTYTIDHQ